MKKIFLFSILSLFVHGCGYQEVNKSVLSDETQFVYKTNYGKKYHNYNCQFLKKSQIEISKKEAIDEGLSACSICKP